MTQVLEKFTKTVLVPTEVVVQKHAPNQWSARKDDISAWGYSEGAAVAQLVCILELPESQLELF